VQRKHYAIKRRPYSMLFNKYMPLCYKLTHDGSGANFQNRLKFFDRFGQDPSAYFLAHPVSVLIVAWILGSLQSLPIIRIRSWIFVQCTSAEKVYRNRLRKSNCPKI